VSVIEELKGLEQRVAQRMAELRPLVDEYHQLEQVAERLGVSQDAAAGSAARTRGPARRVRADSKADKNGNAGRSVNAPGQRSPRSPAARRSRDGGRRDQLLAVVNEKPGITVREAGARLGVDPTSLYRIVHKLEQDGALRKNGRELLPG